MIGSFSLSGVVRATTMTPVMVFGFVALSRFLGLDRPLVVLAFTFYALSALFTMMAGAMSGLMFPFIVEAAHAPGADIENMRAFGLYTTWLNRSFAQVHFDLASIAVLLWSIAWPAKTALAWIARTIGFAAGLGVLAWHLYGEMNIEARQGALWVTLAHAAYRVVHRSGDAPGAGEGIERLRAFMATAYERAPARMTCGDDRPPHGAQSRRMPTAGFLTPNLLRAHS